MNTKIIMTISALVLGISGILMTFIPDTITYELFQNSQRSIQVMVQITGGLYFGFAMLNWMVKGSLIGGIYNRPIAVANFTHFMVSGIALFKMLNTLESQSTIWWVIAMGYLVLGVCFGYILFYHPLKTEEAKCEIN